ncbi:hypothetical protein WDZ92_38595, partial [Nostoc sp. NIES-2111]
MTRRFSAAAAALAAAFFLTSPTAQAQQGGERRGGPPGDFDFYVLALSWSPGFCEIEGDRKGRDQCEDGSGLGFVVHGLWPQYTRGFPTECSPANRSPSRIALEAARGVYPDEGLARYQWRKHGTCSGLSPTEYYETVRAARDKVTIPPALVSPRSEQTFTPIELERAFAAANPGLRTDMMAVACSGGVLGGGRGCIRQDGGGFPNRPGGG